MSYQKNCLFLIKYQSTKKPIPAYLTYTGTGEKQIYSAFTD